MRRQCELLSVSRGTVYYKGVGESKENLRLMTTMDRLFTEDPTLGVLGMQDELADMGIHYNIKRILRLLRKMGVEPMYPKKGLRTLKQQSIYLNPPETGLSLFHGVRTFLDKYNQRRHQGTNRKKAMELYHRVA